MGGAIERDPRRFQAESYDLVVIGGGIYGVAATLAAARSGRRVLLAEREDFGGATTWNTLRVLGSRLPYPQLPDLRHAHELVTAHEWFAREVPELIEPLACVMPLYGKGFRRRVMVGPVLALRESLHRLWSAGGDSVELPASSLLSKEDVIERFGAVRRTGLRGGALWFDGFLDQPQRVLIEMLRRAVANGAVALNYMEVTDWEISNGRVAAVRARDSRKWSEYEFRTGAVLNCAGPWAAALAARDDPHVYQQYHPLLAFNLLLDHPLESAVAVAVEPPEGERTCFVIPRDQRTLAGTYYAPWKEGDGEPTPAQVEEFLADLRAGIPDFHVTREHVLRVMSGIIPARRSNAPELATHPISRAAADDDGPEGLFTLIGSGYMMAPLAAEAAVTRIFGDDRPRTSASSGPPPIREVPGWTAFGLWADRDPEAAGALLDAIVREESVIEPDDLLLRRTDWGLDPRERNRTYGRIRQLRPRLFDRSE